MAALHQFNHNQSAYVYVSEDNRIKVWDVFAQQIRQEHVEKDHLMFKYTALAWCSRQSSSALSKKKKPSSKRQKTESSSTSGLLALGTDQGRIVIWDLALNQVIDDAQVSTSAIQDLIFDSTGSTIYSCSKTDRHVMRWDLQTLTTASSAPEPFLKAGKKSIHKLCLSHDDSILATACTTIKCWDMASRQKSIRFTSGHSSFITELIFSKCNKFLFSCSRGGRFINAFQCNGQTKEPLMNFALESGSPVSLFAQVNPSTSDCVLGAVSNTGALYIWKKQLVIAQQGEEKDRASSVPIEPTAYLKDTLDILNADFSSTTSDEKIQLVRGSVTKLLFESLTFVQDKLTLSSQEPKKDEDHEEVEEAIASEDLLYTTSSSLPHIPTLTDREGKKFMCQDQNQETMLVDEDIEDEDDEASLPLADRLKKLQESWMHNEDEEEDEEEREDDVTKIPMASATSLVSILDQALQTKDNTLLEYCLRSNDPEVVDATVKRLPSQRVIPFLTTIVAKFEKRPTRAVFLCLWIKSILMNHTAFLMATPDLIQNLSLLYQTFEARLRVFQPLHRVSGRLDLVLTQISKRQEKLSSMNIIRTPAKVYTEEDDDEAEAEPVMMDSGEESE